MKPVSHLHFTFTVILLLAILVKGLIPVGFMPSESKTVALTICSGLEIKTVFVQDHDTPKSHDQNEDHQPCPFASPVFAYNGYNFNLSNYISVAYAKFHPHQRASTPSSLIAFKPFFAQGPPVSFSA